MVGGALELRLRNNSVHRLKHQVRRLSFLEADESRDFITPGHSDPDLDPLPLPGAQEDAG